MAEIPKGSLDPLLENEKRVLGSQLIASFENHETTDYDFSELVRYIARHLSTNLVRPNGEPINKEAATIATNWALQDYAKAKGLNDFFVNLRSRKVNQIVEELFY